MNAEELVVALPLEVVPPLFGTLTVDEDIALGITPGDAEAEPPLEVAALMGTERAKTQNVRQTIFCNISDLSMSCGKNE